MKSLASGHCMHLLWFGKQTFQVLVVTFSKEKLDAPKYRLKLGEFNNTTGTERVKNNKCC